MLGYLTRPHCLTILPQAAAVANEEYDAAKRLKEEIVALQRVASRPWGHLLHRWEPEVNESKCNCKAGRQIGFIDFYKKSHPQHKK